MANSISRVERLYIAKRLLCRLTRVFTCVLFLVSVFVCAQQYGSACHSIFRCYYTGSRESEGRGKRMDRGRQRGKNDSFVVGRFADIFWFMELSARHIYTITSFTRSFRLSSKQAVNSNVCIFRSIEQGNIIPGNSFSIYKSLVRACISMHNTDE